MTIIKPKPTLKVHDAKYNYNYKVLPSLTMACNIFNPWMAGWAMKAINNSKKVKQYVHNKSIQLLVVMLLLLCLGR
jgi:hypothetical protein